MKTRKELRAEARDVLGHKLFGGQWLMFILVSLVFGIIMGLAAEICFIPVLIIGGALSVGYAKTVLGVTRRQKEKADFENLFDGFKEDFKGNLVLFLLQYIFIFLWSLLLVIPGIIKSYSYRMSYFIKVDNPTIGANDAITESRKMMNGHKLQLFILDLSFIGWYIVGYICCGVGTLWVSAYHEATVALFYDELKKNA